MAISWHGRLARQKMGGTPMPLGMFAPATRLTLLVKPGHEGGYIATDRCEALIEKFWIGMIDLLGVQR